MPNEPAINERLYTVWRAYGETMIVSGSEPVWEEPGKQAEKVAELTAGDYESACDKWNQQVHEAAAKQFQAAIGDVVKSPTV